MPSAKRYTLLALVLVAATIVLVLALRIQPVEHDPSRGDAPLVHARDDAGAEAQPAARDTTTAARLSADELYSRLASSSTEHAPAEAVQLDGRVVSASGEPVHGAWVELWDSPARRPAIVLAGDALDAPFVHARSETDARGRFRFFVAPEVTFALHARHAQLGRILQSRASGGDSIELRLFPSASVRGRVSRARDGAFVAGAEIVACIATEPMVACWNWWEDSEPVGALANASVRALARVASTTTAADGSFELGDLFHGIWTIVVKPLEEQLTVEVLGLQPNEVRGLDVAVLDGRIATGIVRDAGTKRPIDGATVRSLEVGGRDARTDASGAFRMTGVGENVVLAVDAAGYGRQNRLSADRGMAGQHVVDFELVKEQRARGRVVDPLGRPLSGVAVVAVTSELGWPPREDVLVKRARSFDGLRVTTGPVGEFELARLDASAHSALIVSAAGFGTELRRLSSPVIEPATETDKRRVRPGPDLVELGTLVLRPSASIVVRTLREEGGPAPGMPVDLGVSSWKHARNELITGLISRRGRTGTDGRIEFDDLTAGTYMIEARFDTGLDKPRVAASGTVELARGATRADLELRIPKRHLVRGTVIDPWGNALAGAQLTADGMLGQVESDAAGSFEIELAKSTPTTIRARWFKGEYAVGERRASLAMATQPGALPGGHAVVLQLLRQLPTHGHVRRGGTGVPEVGLQACDSRGEVLSVAFTGKDGAFEIQVVEGELVTLLAHANANPPGQSGMRIRAGAQPIGRLDGVAAGRTDVVIELP